MIYKSYYIVISIFCLVLALPLLGIISRFEFESSFLSSQISNKYNLRLIYITLLQAALSAFLSCLIALTFSLSLYRHKNSKIVKSIISLCGYSFVLPSILVVYSVIGIFGMNGVLNKFINFYEILNIRSLFGLKAILIAHIFLNAPFATRIFYQNLNTIPLKYIEISKTLRMGFIAHIIKLEWPILKQNLFSVFSLIFVLCFLSFAIVMTLGGGPKTSTIEVAIYQSAIFELNFNKAIFLSSIQIIFCSIFLLFGFYKLKGSSYFEIHNNYFNHPFNTNKLVNFFDFIIIVVFSLILFSPLIYIISNFILKFNLNNIIFKQYFINAFKNSFLISILTSIIVTITALMISLLLVKLRKDFFLQQFLFFISSIILIISPIIISLGYFIILGELRYFQLIQYLVVIIINCIFLIPFGILILFTKLKNIFLNFDDIKETYRISEFDFIKIIFPLIKKNILFIFSFTAAISFGDFTIISFFKNDNFQTLPTLLYKLIGTYRFYEASFVAGFILIFSLLLYLIFDKSQDSVSPVINK